MVKLARRPATLAIPALLTLVVAGSLYGQEPPAASAPAPQPTAAVAADAAVPAATPPSTTETATTQTATAPATAPAEAATLPAATRPDTAAMQVIVPSSRPTTGPTTISSHITFNFKDASVDAVLSYISETLGFIVIKDSKLDGRVSITSKQPVTADEAVELLNSVLKPLNYTALQTDRVLRIVPRDQAKKANIPVHFGIDPLKIKTTDELITQVIPVANVDAVKLKADLTPLLSTDADVAANQASNTIIVTDSSANIHRIVEIIAALDQHKESVSDIKIFQLKYASATSAAKLIGDIFKSPDSSSSSSSQNPMQNFFRSRFGFGGPGGPGGGGGGGGEEDRNSIAGKVNASADDRTNTLVVSGPTDTLKVVEQVVKQLDANPAADQTFFIYPLKNGQAIDLEPVLNTLFGNSTSGSSGTSANRTNSTSSLGSTGSSGFGSFGGSSGFGGGSSLGSSGGFGTSSSRQNTGSSGTTTGSTYRPSVSSTTAAAANALAGQVFFVANQDTNSLLVNTSSKLQDQVKKILDDLDRPVAQVLIKVLIAEVTHNNTDDIGVEWSILNKRPSGNGQSGGTDFGIASAIKAASAAGGPNGLVVQVVEENVTAALRALATTNKLDVLSRPSILASDNQLASMIVGQEVPIITNSQITDTGQTINSVSYQNVGVILSVTPHINPEGMVTLDVAQQVSQLDTGSGVPISSNVTAPIFDIRAAQTRVGIKNGQTIVIGGLMQDQSQETINKFPILGDIPYLGYLFKHTTHSKVKTELLVFITPHVALQPEILKGMSKDEQTGMKLTPEAVGPGVFQEHMHGMQLGATTTQPDTTQPATGPATRPAVPAATEPK